jgi:pyruvate,water dikinase
VLGCRLPSAPPPHQVISLDWYRPLPAETAGDSSDPDSGARHLRIRARREAAEAATRSALAGRPKQLRQFEARLAEAQEFAAIREELIAEFTLGWPVMRVAMRRLGEDLVRRSILTDWGDIFFLTREELISASEDLAGVAAKRKATWETQRRLTPPLHLGPPQPMYQQMMDGAAEAFRAPAAVVGLELLRGMPCSPGIARGRVRVIYGPEGFDSFKAGEVLVAPATTPGWTPLFARAVAVITDTGSVTAHASLVAREYGIPAVVSTGDATQKLQDGMLVTVDGSAGVVLEGK